MYNLVTTRLALAPVSRQRYEDGAGYGFVYGSRNGSRNGSGGGYGLGNGSGSGTGFRDGKGESECIV